MHLLYVSRTNGIHDERFIDAWRAAGLDVAQVTLPDETEASKSLLATRLKELLPDIVQVGPITSPGHLVEQLWAGPTIATSWGFDLLSELPSGTYDQEGASRLIRRADVLFVDNDATASMAVEFGACPEKIIQFPWGLDPSWFLPEPATARATSELIVLSTRNHEPIYRVEQVLEAFARSDAAHTNSRLWLAGSGSLTNELKSWAKDLGVESQVSFLGRQRPDQLKALLSKAHIYVSASETDGSSISLLEAFARGVPAIVSDILGNRQWVTEETGWTFPLGDSPALASLFNYFVDPLPLEWGDILRRVNNARRTTMARANWEITKSKFLSYAELAVERSQRRSEG